MSDEEAPPSPTPAPDSVPPAGGGSASEAPQDRGGRDSRRRRLEGVIPEIVRRAVELGVEKAQEAPDNLKSFVGDLKLPKEIGHYLFQQIDETKNGLFRVVAKEIRDFLEHTNFAGEVQKLLTTVQFEVNTTIRFTPNDGRKPTKKTPDDGGSGDDPDHDGDESAETSARDHDDAEPGERRPTPLPKPEVKTAVHVRRDKPRDRDGRRSRRDRAI
jgi:hypothetical protein